MIENAGIIIVGYHPGMPYFNDMVNLARTYQKPLLVYTFEPNVRLDGKHMKIMSEYKWYAISSMPLRLVSDVFSIMASFNYDR